MSSSVPRPRANVGGGPRALRGPAVDAAFGGRRASRGRAGLFGPFPYYSRRTRGGSQVTVSGCGCCLPLALLLTAAPAMAGRELWLRAAR